jgi:hypothetical protein
MDDAKFIVADDGGFVCDTCGEPPENHWSKVEVSGTFQGWTRYRCVVDVPVTS